MFHARTLLSPLSFGIVMVFTLTAPAAFAVDYYKADNTTSLTNAASWWLDAEGTIPATDAPVNTTNPSAVCTWNNLVTGPNTINLADVGIQTLRILDPGGPVTLESDAGNDPRTLTVRNGGGIDMSAATQDLTLNYLYYRTAGSSQTVGIQVKTGRTLTFGPTGQVNVRNSAGGVTHNLNTDGTSAGTIIYGANFAPTNVVIGAGVVQFNNPGGNDRIGTSSTIVNGGRLVVNNSSGSATDSGPVTINSTATLTGQAIIGGLVTINSGATLIPGANGIGTLTTGSLNLAAGSTIQWEGIDPAQADRIVISNSNGLTINGATLELFNAGTTDTFTGDGTFQIFEYAGAIAGAGISGLTVAESTKVAGKLYKFGVSGGFVTLTIGVDNRPEAFWNTDSNGNWSTAANWTGLVSPNAPNFIANLGGAEGVPTTAPRTVTLDSPSTVGTLVFDSAQPFTIAGTETLTFDDEGVAGTLHVESGSHVISTPLALPADGVLTSIADPASTLTLEGIISGDGGIAKSGGTLILTADNSYFGSTSNGSGLMQIGNGGTTGSVNSPIANSGTLRFSRSNELILAAPLVISGTGDVDFAGTGTTYLSSGNTYSGGTTISSGNVIIEDPSALQNSTLTYSSTGGTLSVIETAASLILGGLAGDGNLPGTNTIATPLDITIGQNGNSTVYSGSLIGTASSLTKVGGGMLTLSGTHDFSSFAALNGGVLDIATGGNFSAVTLTMANAGTKLLVSGGTFTTLSSLLLPNATAGLEVTAGTANFDGGITSENNPDNNTFFVNVTGGILNTANLSMGRGNFNLGTEPATGSTTRGLYVDGGAVNITGNLSIGKNATNSSATARLDSGSLTVGGVTTVTINSPDRWSVLDIAGGTFTSTDAFTGVSLGGTTNGQVVMHVRNEDELIPTVANVERIQFGQPDLDGSAILNLSGGSLYVGAGGMTVGSASSSFSALLKLGGGVLGASADSTSNVPVSLTGAAVVTGSDALDAPHTVTFSGSVSGSGSLTKNGSGTVEFNSSGNNFTGNVTVASGVLGLGGQTGTVTVEPSASLIPRGMLTTQPASVINGTLAIRYDVDSTVLPGRIHSQGSLTLGAGSILDISGTGTLTHGVYILASGAGGISGTFGSMTGAVPAGYTLNSSFNDGSGFPVIALVSDTASPYDLWAASFGLTGPQADTDFDADGDGLDNLVEFAMGSNPTQFTAGPVLGRDGNFLTLTFNHIAGSGLTFVIEANDELDDNWDAVHTYPTFASAGTTTYTDNVVIGTGSRRFIRLSVKLSD